MYYLKEKYRMLSFIYPKKWFWIREYSRMLYDGAQDFKHYMKVLVSNIKTISVLESLKDIVRALFMFISFLMWGF